MFGICSTYCACHYEKNNNCLFWIFLRNIWRQFGLNSLSLLLPFVSSLSAHFFNLFEISFRARRFWFDQITLLPSHKCVQYKCTLEQLLWTLDFWFLSTSILFSCFLCLNDLALNRKLSRHVSRVNIPQKASVSI